MDVDLHPLWDYAVTALLAVLTAVSGALAPRLYKKLGLQNDSALRLALDDALTKGINYAVEIAKQRLDNLSTIEVRNEVARKAADYIVPKIPDLMTKIGADYDGIKERVIARFQDPATPVPLDVNKGPTP